MTRLLGCGGGGALARAQGRDRGCFIGEDRSEIWRVGKWGGFLPVAACFLHEWKPLKPTHSRKRKTDRVPTRACWAYTDAMPLELIDTKFENDLDALLHFQDVLLKAVEGARDDELNREFQVLRKMMLADSTYKQAIPPFVRRYRDLGSLWPAFKSFSPQWEPRRVEVRKQFEPALKIAERAELFVTNELGASGYDSTAWTGVSTPTDRIKAVKTLIPVTLLAIEQLIASLEAPNHNGAPPLDGAKEAIEQLRALHSALGKLLAAADEGKIFDTLNDGLATEVARYAKRAAKALRDDPIPYAFSAMILAVMSACGFGNIAGWLAGVAINMKRK